MMTKIYSGGERNLGIRFFQVVKKDDLDYVTTPVSTGNPMEKQLPTLIPKTVEGIKAHSGPIPKYLGPSHEDAEADRDKAKRDA